VALFRIKKQSLALLLAFVVLFTTFVAVGPASSVQAADVVKSPVEVSDTEVLTIDWLSQQYNVSSTELSDYLNQGYPITKILTALNQASIGGKSVIEILEENNPAVKEKQAQLAEQMDQTLQAQKPIDYEAMDVPIITDPKEIEEALKSLPKNRMAATSSSNTYDETVIKRLELRGDQAPYSITSGNESISNLSGDLSLQYTDLVLPGRNGLSFALTRRYDSSQSHFYDKNVAIYPVDIYKFVPEYLAKVFFGPYGTSESPVTNITMIDEFYYNYYGSVFRRVVGQQYPGDGAWSGYFYFSYPQGVFHEEQEKLEKGFYKYRNPATDPYMHWYNFEFTMPNGTLGKFVAKMFPTGRVHLRGVVPGGSGYTVRNVTQEITQTPLGRGWDWDMPEIQTKRSNTYLRMDGGATYQIDASNKIIGYPWKDLTLTNNTSVTVNNMQSSRVLTTLQGTKYYFSGNGKLIQKSDAYGNTLQFHYTSVSPYGYVLTKVIDALGNQITLTYSSSEVVATMGDRVVRYQKQMAPNTTNKELLTAVTDPANRTTRYTYAVNAGAFDLLSSYYPAANNYYALVNGIEHPTGAKTEFGYALHSRTIGKQGESEQFYRVSSREDVLYQTNGTAERYNRVTFSGVDTTYGYSTSFQTVMNDGRTTTTHTFKKQYIDDNTPSVYYNTQIVKQANGTNSVEKQTVTQTFDEARRLPVPSTSTAVTSKGTANASAVTTQQTYDDYGNVLTSTDPNNITTIFTYDPTTHLLNNVTQPIKAGLSSFTEYTRYSPQNTIKQIVTKENNASGTLKSQVNYAYDAYGNPAIVTIKDDQRDIVINTQYGSAYNGGFPTTQSIAVTNASGVTETVAQQMEYTKLSGEMTKFIDPKGYATTYQYDKLGRIVKVTNPDTSYSTVVYEDTANQATVTDPTGVASRIKWNPFGWKVSSGIVGKGEEKQGYDSYGRTSWNEDGAGNRTTYQYDNWDRIIQSNYPGTDNAFATISYDDIARTVLTTEAEGNKTRTSYDTLGRTLKQEALNTAGTLMSSSAMTYDYTGNVLTNADAKNNKTTLTYDVLGRLISVMDPDNLTTTYTYSSAGNLKQVQYPDQSKRQKVYDQMGRLIQEIDPLGQVETYVYDLNSNLTQRIDRKGQAHTNSFNNRDWLVSSVTANEPITYSYDLSGRRLWMQDATGKTQYAYESSSGWLTQVTYPDLKTTQYQYDLQGRRTQMTDPFGIVTAYAYDVRNRLSAVGPVINNWDATYGYKKNGLLATRQLRNGLGSTYGYNEMNLTSLVQSKVSSPAMNTFSYTYDLNRNQTGKTENGATHTFTYGKLDRIATSTQFEEQYTYDLRGNRQTLATTQTFVLSDKGYQYDGRDRLFKVTKEEGGEVSYRYNGDGLMVERTEDGHTTRYYYDGADIIAEGTVNGGAVAHKASYIRGNGLVSRVDANGSKAYYMHNGHGDVVGLTDAAGNLLNSYSYDLWGKPIVEEETVENPFRYSGEYWDETTDLQYLRARWYDPSIGRFINEDTYEGQINNPLTLNLYTYVGNNPLTRWDPSGHSWAGDIWNNGVEGMKWLGNRMWYDLTHVDQRAMEVADFLIVDDIKTVLDPNSSNFDKGLALAGFIPFGKVIKGGKLVIKLVEDGKVIERAVDATDDAIRAATKLGKNDLKHILSDHSVAGFSNQVPYLSDAALAGKLNSKSFFNPKWSNSDIINGVEAAYAAGLKKGISNSTFQYTYKGEAITIFINKDGNLSTAFGSYKLDASYFGR